jgi:aconitate hydratase
MCSRRGNWEVMLRGLFTNRSVRNLLAPVAPGATVHAGSGEQMPLWRAANQSVVILAGERYGMGSSRDWAAKGVALLGARAVLALGFERIHRSNLIGMGILHAAASVRMRARTPFARAGGPAGDRCRAGADFAARPHSCPISAPRATAKFSTPLRRSRPLWRATFCAPAEFCR